MSGVFGPDVARRLLARASQPMEVRHGRQDFWLAVPPVAPCAVRLVHPPGQHRLPKGWMPTQHCSTSTCSPCHFVPFVFSALVCFRHPAVCRQSCTLQLQSALACRLLPPVPPTLLLMMMLPLPSTHSIPTNYHSPLLTICRCPTLCAGTAERSGAVGSSPAEARTSLQ